MAVALKTMVAKGGLQPCRNHWPCNCRNHAATIGNIGATKAQPSQHRPRNCRNRSLRDWPLVAGQPRQRFGRLKAPSLGARSHCYRLEPGDRRSRQPTCRIAGEGSKGLEPACVCLCRPLSVDMDGHGDGGLGGDSFRRVDEKVAASSMRCTAAIHSAYKCANETGGFSHRASWMAGVGPGGHPLTARGSSPRNLLGSSPFETSNRHLAEVACLSQVADLTPSHATDIDAHVVVFERSKNRRALFHTSMDLSANINWRSVIV